MIPRTPFARAIALAFAGMVAYGTFSTFRARNVAALRQQIAAPSPVVRVHLEQIQYATGRPHFYNIDSVSRKDPE